MPRRFRIALALAVATALLAACGRVTSAPPAPGPDTPPPFDLAAMRKVIEAQNDRFTKAHVAGDIAAIDAMFTRDARSLPPGAAPSVGVAAIHELTAEYLEAGVHEFREETTDFYGHQDLLVDAGTYVMIYGAERTVEHGKYLNVWTREDGAWKIRTNIWNASPSPASPR